MFGWIPIIGPIIDGVVHIFTKYEDTQLGKYTVDGKVDVESMKASTNIIEATKDDIGIRLLRDCAITMPVAWSALIGWDTIVAIRYPALMFHVAPYPESVQWLPYASLMFLLGNIGFNAWKRK